MHVYIVLPTNNIPLKNSNALPISTEGSEKKTIPNKDHSLSAFWALVIGSCTLISQVFFIYIVKQTLTPSCQLENVSLSYRPLCRPF